MIKLTQEEIDALHASNRIELIRGTLVDKNGITKCELELIDGTISHSTERDIQKTGSLTYRLPNFVKRVEDKSASKGIIFLGDDGKKYLLSVESTGLISTEQVEDGVIVPNPQIKIDATGTLYTENVIAPFEVYHCIDSIGFTWEVSVEPNGDIYSLKTATGQKVYYRDERVEVDYLNDRIKIEYGIVIGPKVKWWSKGWFAQIKPKEQGGIVTTTIYDDTLVLSRTRVLEDKVFAAGTNYVDVLQYFIIYSGFIKIRIEPTDLVLRSDVVVDSRKSCLQWFNYFADQINYTKLYVDGDGWFISNKYKEPTPSMVGYIYEANDISVISGNLDKVADNTNVYNVFRRTVSHPTLGEMTSTYINKDPTDKYSTVNTSMNYSEEVIDNIASQTELDNYTRKEAFKAKQITEEITFNTLIMPHHEGNEILELRHLEATGIVVESGWSIKLKSGTLMQHKAKRLVNLND